MKYCGDSGNCKNEVESRLRRLSQQGKLPCKPGNPSSVPQNNHKGGRRKVTPLSCPLTAWVDHSLSPQQQSIFR